MVIHFSGHLVRTINENGRVLWVQNTSVLLMQQAWQMLPKLHAVVQSTSAFRGKEHKWVTRLYAEV
jgi:hypothetical protein